MELSMVPRAVVCYTRLLIPMHVVQELSPVTYNAAKATSQAKKKVATILPTHDHTQRMAFVTQRNTAGFVVQKGCFF